MTAKATLSEIKYRMLSSMSQKRYWTLMGRFRAVRAVTSQYSTLEDSLRSGEDVVEMLRKLDAIDKQATVLQIGSGIGRIEGHLHAHVGFCYGIDISPTMVAKARANVRASNVSFVCTDQLSSLRVEPIDLILSVFVFQHLPRERTAQYVKESFAKLKQGGKLIFQILVDDSESMPEPSRNHPYGLRYYRRRDVRDLLTSVGFAEIRFLEFPSAGEDLGQTGDLLVVASKP